MAPDVIKNTNLKIVHRIVSGDDREVLGRAMAMSERQVAALSSLQKGQAAVFSGALDDAPILVEVKPAKTDRAAADIISGDRIRKNITNMRKGLDNRIFRQTSACEENCPDRDAEEDCKTAAILLESVACRAALSRLVLSMTENPTTAQKLWDDVRTVVEGMRSVTSNEQRVAHCLAVRAAAWFSNRRGAQAGWSYQESRRFEGALRRALLSLIDGAEKEKCVRDFGSCALDLHKRAYQPYRCCDAVCAQSNPPVCLYRFGAADALNASAVKDVKEAINSLLRPDDSQKKNEKVDQIWYETQKVGYQLVAMSEEADAAEKASVEGASLRASFCFLQQLISQSTTIHPREANWLLDLISEKTQTVSQEEPVPKDPKAGGE